MLQFSEQVQQLRLDMDQRVIEALLAFGGSRINLFYWDSRVQRVRQGKDHISLSCRARDVMRRTETGGIPGLPINAKYIGRITPTRPRCRGDIDEGMEEIEKNDFIRSCFH